MADSPVTLLLRAWSGGDREALDRLTPLVYGELRRVAGGYMRRERSGHTLSPTELVSEAFLRLAGSAASFDDRVQFFAMAARHMRQILTDHARSRLAAKRGGREEHVALDEAGVPDPKRDELVTLDDAMGDLATLDERKARVVELRYFGGMTHEEIGAALGIHESTVARELKLAEAWLQRYLDRRA